MYIAKESISCMQESKPLKGEKDDFNKKLTL